MKSHSGALLLVFASLAFFAAIVKGVPAVPAILPCANCADTNVDCPFQLFDDTVKLEETTAQLDVVQSPKPRVFQRPASKKKYQTFSATFTYADALKATKASGVFASGYRETVLVSVNYKTHGNTALDPTNYLVNATSTCSMTFVDGEGPADIDFVTASTNDH